jgi:hypothetical protein
MKVEEVSVIEVEEECPVALTLTGIKSEQEVRCMSVCPLLGMSKEEKSHYIQ